MFSWRIILIATLFASYLAYVALFYLAQRHILFPGQHLPAVSTVLIQSGVESIWLETTQGKVEMWYLAPMGASPDQASPDQIPTLIMAHGNGELIDIWIEPMQALRKQGFGVLLIEYPGYGRSAGKPSLESINETMLLGYDWLVDRPEVDPERIVLFGRSIGGGAISLLADQRPSAALILFSTFQNITSLASAYFVPTILVRDPFDNLSVVENYTNPVLVLHGDQDERIPYVHGQALSDAAPDGELITLHCGHNNCVDDWHKFWQEMIPFLTRAGVF